ncbi:MAG: hypothetical protein Fur0010_26470 [Bdellovibrio sp.]
MNQDDTLNLMARGKKVIYFVDRDIELLKRIGNQIEENFPDFEIVGMIKLDDVQDELKKNPPMVIVIDIELSEEEVMRKFFETLRDNEVYKKLPVIVTGTRQILEQRSSMIERFELDMVPKSIRVPFLIGMLSSAIQQASSIQSRLIEIKSGDFLFKEGQRGDSIYVLREGALEVVKMLDGKEVIIGTIHDQQMIGEMAYLEKKLRTASVRATQDSKVLELQLGNVDKFLEQQPFWLRILINTLVDRIRDSNQHIMELEKRLKG